MLSVQWSEHSCHLKIHASVTRLETGKRKLSARCASDANAATLSLLFFAPGFAHLPDLLWRRSTGCTGTFSFNNASCQLDMKLWLVLAWMQAHAGSGRYLSLGPCSSAGSCSTQKPIRRSCCFPSLVQAYKRWTAHHWLLSCLCYWARNSPYYATACRMPTNMQPPSKSKAANGQQHSKFAVACCAKAL